MREAGDDMDVQLRHHISERRDVHFIGAGELRQMLCYLSDFLRDTGIIYLIQIEEFPRTFAPRHQYQPREMLVIHQQHSANRQIA